jgi:predicted nuclease with RNAse H fold
MNMRIIGIDCATQSARVGLALGRCTSRGLVIEDARRGGKGDADPIAVAAEWVRDESGPVLLALDAPLGWPVALSWELESHMAGQEIQASAKAMFLRETDRQITKRVGLHPLAVGADRIAHTALAALRLLGQLRRHLEIGIPLAWNPEIQEPSVIEVYPAATMRSRGANRGLKMEDLAVELAKCADIRAHAEKWARDRDVVDAMICTLAGFDFLTRRAVAPGNAGQLELARREGWIWCA